MILAVTKKIFPLCPLLAMLIACGKKVEDGSPSETQLAGINLPSIIALEASATANSSHQDHVYTITRDGNIEIPSTVASSTTTGTYRLRLDVNVLDGEEEFHCHWTGKGTFYEFEGCKDYDGIDLGLNLENISKFTFPIDQGKKMKLRLERAPAGTTVRSYMELAVNWI